MKLKALGCKGGEFKASVTYSFHLFRRMYFKLTTYTFLYGYPKFNIDFAVHCSVNYRKKPVPLKYPDGFASFFKCMWLMNFN